MRRKDTLLMRYLDGEVTASERRAAEELLRTSAEARSETAALGDLGRALRGVIDDVTARQSFDGLTDRIERAARAAPPAGWLERLRVRVRAWSRPAALWPAAAAATIAVAALVAVGLGALRTQSNTCTIESVEYSGTTAAIFMIPDERGTGSTTVIWAPPSDQEEAEGNE